MTIRTGAVGRLAAGVTVALALTACGGGGGTPEEVVAGYYEAMADDDFAQACEYLAPEVVSDLDGDCEAAMAEAKAQGDSQEMLDQIEVTGAHVNEAESTATVTAQSGDKAVEVRLKLISGEWLMTEIG